MESFILVSQSAQFSYYAALLYRIRIVVTKPIVKICYKLLYVIQGVKSIFDKVTSWPQL